MTVPQKNILCQVSHSLEEVLLFLSQKKSPDQHELSPDEGIHEPPVHQEINILYLSRRETHLLHLPNIAFTPVDTEVTTTSETIKEA